MTESHTPNAESDAGAWRARYIDGDLDLNLEHRGPLACSRCDLDCVCPCHWPRCALCSTPIDDASGVWRDPRGYVHCGSSAQQRHRVTTPVRGTEEAS